MPLFDYPIHAISGFLGSPSDWSAVLKEFKDVHLYNPLQVDVQLPFCDWAEQFNALEPARGILAGYSLGGRLALHAALINPDRWHALIIISSHTGLSDLAQKTDRLQSDQRWAERFRFDAWDSVLNDWNQQEVFRSPFPQPRRLECDFDRKAMAGALTEWSLGMQEDLAERISKLQIPILWVVGENDRKFAAIAKELTFAHPHSKIWIAPKAGHRVIFDASEELNQQINYFISILGSTR